MALLSVKNVSRSFGQVKALRNVNFELEVGEVHAICGENGAGKSTLMNMLSGNLLPDEGDVLLNGNPVHFKNQLQANHAGIAIVYQHLSLFDNQTVAENVFVNHFPVTKNGLIDYQALKRQTSALLDQLRISHLLSPDTRVSELSPGQKQMVEIAKALSRKPDILILDEPTASISAADAATLFDIIRQLKSTGVSIIYISHRLEEIFTIADRVTVLKDGCLVGVKKIAELSRETLISMMVGRDILQKNVVKTGAGKVVLEVRGLTNEKLKNVSFQIRSGEILALAGLVGAGRTEIARTIFGDMPLESGCLILNGKEILIQNPGDAIRHNIAYVPEERKTLGLFAEMSIAENINSVVRSEKKFLRVADAETFVAAHFREKLRINSYSVDQPVSALSGGNQQKVVLAKWLSTKPQVLIVDEPTHGIDIGSKFEIYDLLQELAENGVAILLISSELSEVLAISDRILVIKNGAISKELRTRDTSEKEIMQWAM